MLVTVLLFAVTGEARGQCLAPAPSSYATGGAPATGKAVNDPLFARQWALEQIAAPAAWARGFRGRGTLIAVIDSGVDLAHPDLRPALVEGADVHAQVTGEADCPPGPQDEYGHGTHVAGIAGARGNNGIGVAGVAPEASILPVKVGNENGIAYAAVVAGIRYAADRGADVANLSVATGEKPSPVALAALEPELEAAVEYAWQRGTIVVGAAGNDTGLLCKYPGAARRSICVTASNRAGQPASYSNLPADADGTTVVRAPGGGGAPGTVDLCEDNVISTIWPRSDIGSCYRERGVRGYETAAGTSMAAPHVAGLVALLAGAGLGAQEIVDRVKASAAGNTFGIVSADAATEGLPVPAPPPPVPAGPPPAAGAPAPSAAERRCTQARATLARAKRRLRSARRHGSRRLVQRRRAQYRRASADARRRCR